MKKVMIMLAFMLLLSGASGIGNISRPAETKGTLDGALSNLASKIDTLAGRTERLNNTITQLNQRP